MCNHLRTTLDFGADRRVIAEFRALKMRFPKRKKGHCHLCLFMYNHAVGGIQAAVRHVKVLGPMNP